MKTGHEAELAKIFARAFVNALPNTERSRVSSFLLGPQPLTLNDLHNEPALGPLFAALEGSQHPYSDDVLNLLQSALVARDPAQDAAQPEPTLCPFTAITEGVGPASALLHDTPVQDPLTRGLFQTVLAMKEGDLAKADALIMVLSEQFDIPSLEDCTDTASPELSSVLFMKAIYSDTEISALATERLFELLARIPKEEALLRAILYNVAVDVYLRQHKMSEAEQAAHRALHHYLAAGETGVAFYVHLYLAVIGLWRGDSSTVSARLAEARAALSEFKGALANDALLLRSFELIVLYEEGDTDAFVAHLMGDAETIPFGELWPSIADPIISFGRRALASKVTPAAALSWVRRWRVKQRRSLRFDRLISLQEALALQDLGRWQEADEVLGSLQGTDDVDPMIARFASGLDRYPKSTELGQQISACLSREDLSARQSLMLLLLAAQNALARGVEREAARHLSVAVRDWDPGIHVSMWAEQRARVAACLSKRELRSELQRFPRLRRQIKSLSEVEATQKPAELTRQEFRVLQLLAEAQSNKAIGLRLGISLPTVKFHVSNLGRKAQVRSRREIVRVAVGNGWLPDL